MALEQWEIDLRRQLDQKINNPKRTTTPPPLPQGSWEDRLQQEFGPTRPAPQQPQKPNQQNNALWVVMIVLLALANLYIWNDRNEGTLYKWVADKFGNNQPQVERIDPFPALPPSQQPALPHQDNNDIRQLREELAKQKKDVEELTAKVKWNHHRLTLMGALLNENFLIIRNNADRSHLIFFNRDWTLDKMPRYVELSDEDREYLRKFVK